MSKKRHNYSPEEKVLIMKRHLVGRETVSDLCDEYQLLYSLSTFSATPGMAGIGSLTSPNNCTASRPCISPALPGRMAGSTLQAHPPSRTRTRRFVRAECTNTPSDAAYIVFF